jgi:hypothetical protein
VAVVLDLANPLRRKFFEDLYRFGFIDVIFLGLTHNKSPNRVKKGLLSFPL